MSPGEFAAKLSSMASQIGAATTGMDKAAKILQDRAKEVIGTYDLGWPELAASTLQKKGADTPLLETGGLRDSIERTVEPFVAYVGTNNPVGRYQELGTSKIPPRSFIAASAAEKEKEIVEAIILPVSIAFGSAPKSIK
jgi:phage gpG-like protein